MDDVTFIRKTQDAIETRTHIDRRRTEDLIGAVFSALSARLTQKEGENLISQLPLSLKNLWRRVAIKRPAFGGQKVDKLSKEEFLAKILETGRLDSPEEAEFVARCVIHALKEAIAPGEIRDAAQRLPGDLREFLMAA